MITGELESDLRATFARAAAGITVPEATCARLRAHDYRLPAGRRRVVFTAGTGLVAAGAMAAGLIVAGGPAGTVSPSGTGSPAGTVAPAGTGALPAVSFDAYTFTMPAGFRRVHPSPRCRPTIVLAGPLARPGHWVKVVLPVQPKYGKKMMLAASAAGGCLGVVLAQPYRPTVATPDPDIAGRTRPIRIGSYHGRYLQYEQRFESRPNGPVTFHELVRQVYVELPVGHGRYRDLAVAGARLSRHELITIVVDGPRRRG